ncbi:MAG: HAMP domain-containing protein, partial [Acidobacteriota bacterium]|nr:HAMP domain-containing protein [Acidobacteriota bacterium]
MHQRSFPQQAVSVFDGERLISRFSNDGNLSVAQPLAPGAARTLELAGTASRVAVRPVRVASRNRQYLICAAESLAPIDQALQDLRRALLTFFALALLLAAGAGYYMARESLRPVTDMTAAVNRISSRDLSQALPVANANDELGQLASTFNDLLRRLEAAFEQQRRFIGDASHELKTPLSVALLSAQVALDRPRSAEEYRETLATIRAQMVRLNGMVRDMLTLARLDAGGYTLNRKACDFGESVTDAIRMARVLAAQKQISIAFDPSAEAPYLGDPDLLQ